jgi:hypothetical protein
LKCFITDFAIISLYRRLTYLLQVSQKTFIANIVTQVIERHIVRGLEDIFSPVVVNALSEEDVVGIASEPAQGKRHRAFLKDRKVKLENGRKILRRVMKVVV